MSETELLRAVLGCVRNVVCHVLELCDMSVPLSLPFGRKIRFVDTQPEQE